MSTASNANKRMVTLADLDNGLRTGTIRVQAIPVRQPYRAKKAGDGSAATSSTPASSSTTFACVDTMTGKQLQLVLGHGTLEPSLNPRVVHAGPPISNPASKVHFCLVEVPASDQEALKSVRQQLIQAALALNIVTTDAQLKLPFSIPDDTAAASSAVGNKQDVYGVWTRWFVDCKTSVNIVEVTRDAPLTFPEYPAERVLPGMHIGQVADLTPFEAFNGNMCMNAITRFLTVDSTEANHDEAFERPVIAGKQSKIAVPLTANNIAGYFIVDTAVPDSLPIWVPADDASVAACRVPITIDDMKDKLASAHIGLEVKTTTAAKATDKHPAGTIRKFLNQKHPSSGATSNVLTMLGSLDADNPDRPYVAVGAHTFPSALDPFSKSALVSYPSKADRDTWRAINKYLYEDIIEKVLMKPGAKKRPSVEAIQNAFHLPAIDPAVEDPAKPRDIAYDEETDTYTRTDSEGRVHQQHIVTYVKMRDAAPKGIEELRTRCFEVNAADSPFSVTEVGCDAVERGRHPLFITEWSELADMKGQRIILHTKLVLLQPEHLELPTYSLDDIPYNGDA